MNDHLVSPEDLRESLWEAYVYPYVEQKPTTEKEKQLAALEVVAMHRKLHAIAQAAGDDLQMFLEISRAKAVFSLLAADELRWTIQSPEMPDFFDAEKWRGKENDLFDLLVRVQDNFPMGHKDAVDPTTMVLPRWLYQRLINALDALQVGDVHDFVAPKSNGKHSAPWAWYQFRVRALQHVAFLNGKGVGKMKAREQVAQAMKVSPKTLREWEGDCKEVVEDVEGHVALAYQAGQLAVAKEFDPSYAEGSVNSELLFIYKGLAIIEPLVDFGRQYRERYGNRHHTPDSAGK